MDKGTQVTSKLSFLLLGAIVFLCAGFLIAGCGGSASNDPQVKTKNTDKGPFAIDFSLCPGTKCEIFSDRAPGPNVGDTEVTVEAWVKSRGTTGGVFSRLDASRGVALYIKNDEPKFAMRVQTAATTTPGAPTPTAEYVVGSGFTLLQDVWTHIAGVIANAVHSHPVSASCISTPATTSTPAVSVPAETPHMDIYINGVFRDCATTFGAAGDPATGPQFADNPGGSLMKVGNVERGPIDGTDGTPEAVIDEVRLWLTGRTEADIQLCMNTELGVGGLCNRGDPNLATYYRLNSGQGDTATDWSGDGFIGSLFKFAPDEEHWADGWVLGNTNMLPAD